MKRKWSDLWFRLTGDPQEFSIDNRAFNAISVLTFLVLLIILPINIYLGLVVVSAIVAFLLVVLVVVYYYARVRRLYKFSMSLYAICSYLTLIANYFVNSGINGPTIYLFFLTFQLLIAFTPRRQYLIWTLSHLVVTSGLLLTEYLYPQLVPEHYHDRNDRFFDLSTAYFVILLCMYCITIYLRSSYQRERAMAAQHAVRIGEQNDQIMLQNQQLQQLNEEKNKLLSLLAHDLRTPLNSITTVLDFLSYYDDISEAQRKELQQELLRTTRSTSDMLSNLLAWSSGQIKGLQPNPVRVFVPEVVDKVMQIQELLAEKKQISIIRSFEPVHARADYNMLELTLRNLVNNAIKFTEHGGTVTVKIYRKSGDCIISVADSGIGMSALQQANLFSMDIHSTYGTNNEIGIGLGLLLSREFIEIQGGSISVESHEGQGSIFYITVPADTTA